jgi:hypothetical protein
MTRILRSSPRMLGPAWIPAGLGMSGETLLATLLIWSIPNAVVERAAIR